MSVEAPEAWVVISRHGENGRYLNVKSPVYLSRSTAEAIARHLQIEAGDPPKPNGVTYHVIGGRLQPLE